MWMCNSASIIGHPLVRAATAEDYDDLTPIFEKETEQVEKRLVMERKSSQTTQHTYTQNTHKAHKTHTKHTKHTQNTYTYTLMFRFGKFFLYKLIESAGDDNKSFVYDVRRSKTPSTPHHTFTFPHHLLTSPIQSVFFLL